MKIHNTCAKYKLIYDTILHMNCYSHVFLRYKEAAPHEPWWLQMK